MSDPYRRRRRASDGTSMTTKVVTTAVVAYGVYRLVDWACQTWWKSNDHDNEQQHATRQGIETTSSASDPFFHPQPPTRQQRRAKQARLARCQMECTQAWYALGSSAMFSVLETATDITQATHRLKELRRNNNATTATAAAVDPQQVQTEQAELWNLVKERSVTRWVATAYAQSLLMLVLTVQVNLWGAQLWHEQQQSGGGALSTAASSQSSMERMQSYRQEHQQVLQQTFGYFFNKGILDLCATVERATQQVLQGWNVLDKAFLHTSPGALLQALDEIRSLVEERQQPARHRRSLWRFFVPPDNYEHGVAESEILAETWDWLESPLLQEALDATLDVTFDYGRQACLPWSLSSSGEEESFSLAQLLPKLKKCAARFQANEQNPLLQRVHQVPTVNEIGIVCFR